MGNPSIWKAAGYLWRRGKNVIMDSPGGELSKARMTSAPNWGQRGLVARVEPARLRDRIRPIVWGLATAAGSFAAIAGGLWGPAQVNLDPNAYLWLAAGSLVPGLITYRIEVRSYQDRQRATIEREEDQRQAELSRADQEIVLTALKDQIEGAKASQGTTARRLRYLGGAVFEILISREEVRAAAIARFEQKLVQSLLASLQVALEGKTQFRVMFIAPHREGLSGESEHGEESDTSSPTTFRTRSASGYLEDRVFEIRKQSRDDVVAKKVLNREAPWEDGVLVKDVSKEPREYRVLELSPDEGVQSYCRMPVTGNRVYLGILCVDAWEANALDSGSREVVGAFATMLAVGLALEHPSTLQGAAESLQRTVPREEAADGQH